MQLRLAFAIATLAACTASSSISEAPIPFAPPPIPPGGGGLRGGASNEEPTCPGEPPVVGTSCSDPVARCRYGADVREDCADLYLCQSQRWKRVSASCTSICPEAFDAIVPGGPCADWQAACSYEQGTCACMPSADGGIADDPDAGDAGDAGARPGTWKCVPPPTEIHCPSSRPQQNEPCVRPVRCDYGSCALGRALAYECSGGYWSWPTSPVCEEP